MQVIEVKCDMKPSATGRDISRWTVLAVFMCIIGLNQFLWLNFASIATTVQARLHISLFQLGLLTSIFPAMNILLALPVGTLLDTRGFRFTVSLGAVIMGISVLLRFNYHAYAWLLAGQFGIAVAQPLILNSVSKFSSTWFERDKGAIANGLGSMAMFLGMIAALIITPRLVAAEGLGFMLLLYAVVTCSGSLLFLLLGRDNPERSAALRKESRAYGGITAYREVTGIKDMLLLIAIMFIGLGFFNGLMTWMGLLLSHNGFTPVQSGTVGAVIIGGGMIGAVVMPVLSNAVRRRKPFLVMATLAGGIFVYPFLTTRSMTAATVYGAMIGFFIISLLPIVLQITTELVGERLTGTATGLLLLAGSIGAVTVIYLMEFINERSHSVRPTLWLLSGLFAAALLLSLLIRETYPRNEHP